MGGKTACPWLLGDLSAGGTPGGEEQWLWDQKHPINIDFRYWYYYY